MTGIFRKADELILQGRKSVLVTVTGIRGEAPTDLGSKMVVSSQGLEAGTVGGGKIEARAIEVSQEMIRTQNSCIEFFSWNLQKDIGMTCGGEVTMLFEPLISSPWKVAVFGAGHVAQRLVPLLCTMNCSVDCFDDREEWRSKFSPDLRLTVHSLKELDAYLMNADEKTFFVVMTQGHSTDVPVLESVFLRFPKPSYIGVIGSDIKGQKIRSDLLARGISMESLEHLHCPIGLKIGTNDPAEIAISIAAELLQVRG